MPVTVFATATFPHMLARVFEFFLRNGPVAISIDLVEHMTRTAGLGQLILAQNTITIGIMLFLI